MTTGLELLSHIVTDTSLRITSSFKERPEHKGEAGAGAGAEAEAGFSRLRRWLLWLLSKPAHALYLVFSDNTTTVHLFFFVAAVLACTSSYSFACLNVFALVEQVPTMMYVLQVAYVCICIHTYIISTCMCMRAHDGARA